MVSANFRCFSFLTNVKELKQPLIYSNPNSTHRWSYSRLGSTVPSVPKLHPQVDMQSARLHGAISPKTPPTDGHAVG